VLLGNEMQWTVKFFLHQSTVWAIRRGDSEGAGDLGAVAYAARKVAMWKTMAYASKSQFQAVHPGMSCIVDPET
jgi:hypothetical protein